MLNEIGLNFGCDKSDEHHVFDNKTYFDIYERHFVNLKQDITFLELGVFTGKSLQT